MRLRVRKPCQSVTGATRQLLLATLLAAATTCGAKADQDSRFAGVPMFDEIRFGVLGADLEDGGGSDDTVALNFEVLTAPLGSRANETILDVLLHPRLHVGANINLDEDGVNQAYAGLTWDYYMTQTVFVEASFGGAVHDGETAGNDPDSYGCALNFRESISLGVNLSENLSLMVGVDHMSNASLCDQNQGLTNAGVRLGYRW